MGMIAARLGSKMFISLPYLGIFVGKKGAGVESCFKKPFQPSLLTT
jgi:hypothetical protein